MSDTPTELRELLVEGKRAFEPDPARLHAVYQRVLRTPTIASEYDVPPSVSKAFPWSWLAAGGAVLFGAALWLAAPVAVVAPASSVDVTPAPARVDVLAPLVVAAPSVRAPEVTARRDRADPPAPVVEDVPSSDWPRRVSRQARPIRREARAAPDPVLQAPSESSDAVPVRYETPVMSTRERDVAATLRDEVRLIARARKALERGDWATAEHALDEHLMTYPVGQLHVERRALLLRARCQAGDLAAARRLRAELVSLASESLLRAVERACPQLAP